MNVRVFRRYCRCAAPAVRVGVVAAASAVSAAAAAAAVTAFVLVIGGCAGPPSPHFYSMASSPVSPSTGPVPAVGQPDPRQSGAVVVAIDAIGLPDQVDRPQIVTIIVDKSGIERVDRSEEHRWAASLQSQIAQVLSEKLAQTLATPYVTAYPQDEAQSPDVRISLNVQRFDAQLGNEAVVDAIWSARDTATGQRRSGHTLARVRIDRNADAYQAVVAAYRAALDQVAEGVAETVRALNPARLQNR